MDGVLMHVRALFNATLMTVALALPAQAERLQLDRGGLALLDDGGRELDRLPLRAKRWDQRPGADGPTAVVLDADRVRPVLVRARAGKLAATPLPVPAFDIETLCLHRDRQGLLHLFLLGGEGLSEQWLLGEDGAKAGAQPLRRLATAPQPSGCEVDDAAGELRFTEPGVGRWAVATDPEGKPRRHLLAAQGDTPADRRPRNDWPVVEPSAQTAPMARRGDAADDPAIWVDPRTARNGRVLGTNKKQGLLVYDLDGRQRQLLEVGRINNVDLRQRVRAGGRLFDLAVATQRDENSLVLFGIASDGRVAELARLPTDLREIYGICVARNAEGGLDAFPNDKDGRIQQYRVELAGGRWQARRLREFRLESQVEGCVVDEANGRLFVGEEKRGIWAVDIGEAKLATPTEPALVLAAGAELQADVEGLALYRGRAGAPSYLVVSSQGDDSYLVLDAAPPFALRGGFRIGINAKKGIDGASETDGLEVSSADFGGIYGDGLLVVQDGHKRLPDGPQNFKYVPWRAVREALRLP